ncbi:unnamed protein product, partial [Durusdinium trenchii]
ANHGSADEVACAKRRRSDVWPTATRAAEAVGGWGAAGGCISGIHLVSMSCFIDLFRATCASHDALARRLGRLTALAIPQGFGKGLIDCTTARTRIRTPPTWTFAAECAPSSYSPRPCTGGKNTIIVQDSTTQANRALGSTLTVTFDRPHQSQGPLAFPVQIEMEELAGRRMNLAANAGREREEGRARRERQHHRQKTLIQFKAGSGRLQLRRRVLGLEAAPAELANQNLSQTRHEDARAGLRELAQLAV